MQMLVVSADEEGRAVGRDGTAGLDAIWQLRAPNFGTGREANRSQPAGVGAHVATYSARRLRDGSACMYAFTLAAAADPSATDHAAMDAAAGMVPPFTGMVPRFTDEQRGCIDAPAQLMLPGEAQRRHALLCDALRCHAPCRDALRCIHLCCVAFCSSPRAQPRSYHGTAQSRWVSRSHVLATQRK